MAASSDSQAKVDRANEHVACLSALIRAFTAKAYRVYTEPDWVSEPDGGAGQVIIFGEAIEQPPSVLWGPVIGDIVHCFRSALDQLAWSLSVAHDPQGPPAEPIPRANPWRNIWFPICVSSASWDAAARNQLWAVDPALLARLKPFQPFLTGQNAPDREPLAVLNELWNIDKHRHLHLVNASVELHDVIQAEGFPGMSKTTFHVVSKRAGGPLVGRAELGRAVLARLPGELLAATDNGQMLMNARVAIDVAFDQGAPAYGGRPSYVAPDRRNGRGDHRGRLVRSGSQRAAVSPMFSATFARPS